MLALFHLIMFSSPRKSGAITRLRKHIANHILFDYKIAQYFVVWLFL